MNSPTPKQVLRLYKHLIKYGNQLKLTDKAYFHQRIRKEFKVNKSLTSPEDISHNFLVSKLETNSTRRSVTRTLLSSVANHYSATAVSCRKMLFRLVTRPLISATRLSIHRFKATIDKSRVPILNEDDLDEQFVRGSGPGGQAVAKTNNAVVLTHKPTGIVVKSHETRSLQQNRKAARGVLLAKLDRFLNGDESVAAQQLRIAKDKSEKQNRKKEKLREQKAAWKDREKP
jgi:peptide chain release factor